jgi:hypothetical protein
MQLPVKDWLRGCKTWSHTRKAFGVGVFEDERRLFGHRHVIKHWGEASRIAGSVGHKWWLMGSQYLSYSRNSSAFVELAGGLSC